MKARSLLRKMGGWFSLRKATDVNCCGDDASSTRSSQEPCGSTNQNGKWTGSVARNNGVRPLLVATPFVMKRWSYSLLYVDEDGDVANEFYQEIPKSAKAVRFRLAKIVSNIVPLGYEDYEIPRLHPDLPYIMCEVEH